MFCIVGLDPAVSKVSSRRSQPSKMRNTYERVNFKKKVDMHCDGLNFGRPYNPYLPKYDDDAVVYSRRMMNYNVHDVVKSRHLIAMMKCNKKLRFSVRILAIND